MVPHVSSLTGEERRI